MAKALMEEISAHVTGGYPEECCGLMIGNGTGPHREVSRIFPAKNLNRDRARDRYELNPADFRRADEAARREGRDIIGIYHSHPDHPCRPSAFDEERAWEGYSYLILSVTGGGVGESRCWTLSEGSFREEILAIEDSRPDPGPGRG